SDCITERVENLGKGLQIQAKLVASRTIDGLRAGISTAEIDEKVSLTCLGMIREHSDSQILAARIAGANLQRQCPPTFSAAIRALHAYSLNPAPGDEAKDSRDSLIVKEIYDFAKKNKDALDREGAEKKPILNYFGFASLRSKNLLKIDDKVAE